MRADPIVVRRVAGTAAVVLLLGLVAVGLDARFTTPGAYEVEAELGRAGSGLRAGTDVKLRGVNVGRVAEVHIADDGAATARLELFPEPRLPDDVVPVVTPKTFLGEKQVELRTERELAAPYLEAGDVLATPAELQPIEPVAVVDQLGRLLRDIDDQQLASFFAAMAAFDLDDADRFGEGIETGAELAEFLASTGPDQTARMGDAARALHALADATDDLTRLAEQLPAGTAVLVDNREALRETVDSVGPFAETVGGFLEVEEETIGALFAVGDRIGAVVDPRLHEIGSMIHGIYRYSLMFGQAGGELDDGSVFAYFRAFLGDEGQFLEICEQLPDELLDVAPGCTTGGRS
jgi:phospholipid/cholesterol/gamma-HCH transport system substrate-binding protein